MTKIPMFLFFIVTVNATQYRIKGGWFFEHSLKEKKAPSTAHIVTSFVRSLLECSMNCIKTDYCQSVGYNRKNRECILQWSLSNDPNMIPVDDPDFEIRDRSPPLEINKRINVSLCQLLTPCQNGANCTDLAGPDYQCTCDSGYTGKNCQDVSVCTIETPCVNGGNCTDGPGLSYSCDCIEGYSGDNCTEVNVCTIVTPCVNGGNCTDGMGLNYTCDCVQGYSGVNCTEVSVCTIVTPCVNGGNCTDGMGLNYTCDCAQGYSGVNCTELSVCTLESPCLNNAECIDEPGLNYTCNCTSGLVGKNCSQSTEILIIGGWWGEPDGASDRFTTEFYDTVDPTRNYLFNQAFGDIYNHVSTFLANDTVIVAGGNNYNGDYFHTKFFNWKLNAYTAGPDMSTFRANGASTTLNGTLIICGGWIGSGNFLKTCEKLVINSGTRQWEWQYIKSMDTARIHHGMVTLNGYVYAIGGMKTLALADQYQATVERYSPDSDVWEYMTPMEYGRCKVAVAELGGMIYACGGFEPGNIGSHKCEQYNPVTNQWNDTTPMIESRVGHSMLEINGKLMAFGGSKKTVEIYEPDTNNWTTTASMIKLRAHFTAVHLHIVN